MSISKLFDDINTARDAYCEPDDDGPHNTLTPTSAGGLIQKHTKKNIRFFHKKKPWP